MFSDPDLFYSYCPKRKSDFSIVLQLQKMVQRLSRSSAGRAKLAMLYPLYLNPINQDETDVLEKICENLLDVDVSLDISDGLTGSCFLLTSENLSTCTSLDTAATLESILTILYELTSSEMHTLNTMLRDLVLTLSSSR